MDSLLATLLMDNLQLRTKLVENLWWKTNWFKNKSCFGCTISCGRVCKVTNEKYAGYGEGPEYETAWSFGGECGIDNLDAVVKANFICNENGLDTISMGSTIGCLLEMYEAGLVKKAKM